MSTFKKEKNKKKRERNPEENVTVVLGSKRSADNAVDLSSNYVIDMSVVSCVCFCF